MGPETRDVWWDPRPGTYLIGGTRDDPKVGTRDINPGPTSKMGPETWDPKSGIRDPRPLVYLGPGDLRPRTLKVDFQKIFLAFSEAW